MGGGLGARPLASKRESMAEREYQNERLTKELDRNLLLEDIDHLIGLCNSYNIKTFTVLFGFAWGNDYHSIIIN